MLFAKDAPELALSSGASSSSLLFLFSIFPDYNSLVQLLALNFYIEVAVAMELE